MKELSVINVVGIRCPETNEVRLLEDCRQCDAFGGIKTKEGWDKVNVRCTVDEF